MLCEFVHTHAHTHARARTHTNTHTHTHSINDNESCADLLMERLNSADINMKDSHGRTPIHAAAFNDHVECLHLLLRRTGAADVPDNQGQTPLMIAARHGHSNIVGEFSLCVLCIVCEL